MLGLILKKCISKLFRCFPIKRDRVLFIGYYGAQYGCNPKYISQCLHKKYKGDVDVLWAFSDLNRHKGIHAVRFGSLRYYHALSTSRVICTNYRMTSDFIKRKGQVYIQTWHSSLRLKMIEGDAEATLPSHYIKMAKHDSAQTDYVVAGCAFSRHTFENSFWYSGQILNYGTPRNDVLISPPQELIVDIKSKLGLSLGTKIAIYAPTFRKDKNTDCYQLDFEGLRQTLSDRFGGEWIVLVRLHPHFINSDLFGGIENVIDVTRYDDIQELLLVSDLLITDYSSLMFDFALSKRPVFLFATDVEDYCRNDRKFYFDIKELPFHLAESNDELLRSIKNFSEQTYLNALNKFNDSVGSFEKGTASESVADLIMKLVQS